LVGHQHRCEMALALWPVLLVAGEIWALLAQARVRSAQ
jgi:hypothetical protein